MLDDSPFTKLLIEPPQSTIESDFCCHAYSLQVHKDPDILRHHNEIFADIRENGITFSWIGYQKLHEKGLLEYIEEEDVQDGDIILYYNELDCLNHSGRIKDGRIMSKWGGRAMNLLTGEMLIGKGVWLHHKNGLPSFYEVSETKFARLHKSATHDKIKNVLLEVREYHVEYTKHGVR